MVAVDKKRTCKIIDFAVSGDSRIKDLRRELKKIWNVTVKIIPLVVGSLVLYLNSLVIE